MTFNATFMNGVIEYVWIVSVGFGTLSKRFSVAQVGSLVGLPFARTSTKTYLIVFPET